MIFQIAHFFRIWALDIEKRYDLINSFTDSEIIELMYFHINKCCEDCNIKINKELTE